MSKEIRYLSKRQKYQLINKILTHSANDDQIEDSSMHSNVQNNLAHEAVNENEIAASTNSQSPMQSEDSSESNNSVQLNQ